MEIVDIKEDNQKKAFINFIYRVYKNDKSFKDTLIGTVKTFLYKTDTFTKQTYIRAVAVMNGDEIAAQCMYIYNEKLPKMQIGFFEALSGQEEAVDMLINEAKVECKKHHIDKIVIGLNGHVSYGVGLLCDNYHKPIPFDSLYNKDYYIKYFEKYGFDKATITEYGFDTHKMEIKEAMVERIYSKFSFRYLNMKKYKEDIILFGDLCNKTLSDTYLYFDRDPLCLYELLKDMKAFLKPENLIFVMKDGNEIGFVFWHPNYNEIIPGGRKNSMVEIGLRFLINSNKIKVMKANALGVLSKYRKTEATIGLLHEMHKNISNKYIGGESNFVWDNNVASSRVHQHMCDRVARHYCVYEINL